MSEYAPMSAHPVGKEPHLTVLHRELDELGSLIANLSDRLGPVRVPRPQAAMADDLDMSPNQIAVAVNMVRSLNHRMVELLAEVEL